MSHDTTDSIEKKVVFLSSKTALKIYDICLSFLLIYFFA